MGHRVPRLLRVSGYTHFHLKDAQDSAAERGWDVVRVAPHAVRAFEGGPDGLELIALGADRPETGDGELVKGFWTD